SLLALPLALTLAAGAAPKPCAPPLGVSAETLLTRAMIARGLAGTEAVALDASRSCIGITVRTRGTARLVELLLRGVEVPAEAVRFRVDSSAIPGGGGRPT
ncbi:MAG TPA: hypothetical protein VMN37_12080, partial [Gemmatimonadales bacterium]|nr:hypothetical protein [Gemmatimonadales bacterium]